MPPSPVHTAIGWGSLPVPPPCLVHGRARVTCRVCGAWCGRVPPPPVAQRCTDRAEIVTADE
eukprot:3457793-Prymnesium_polylepis.1